MPVTAASKQGHGFIPFCGEACAIDIAWNTSARRDERLLLTGTVDKIRILRGFVVRGFVHDIRDKIL